MKINTGLTLAGAFIFTSNSTNWLHPICMVTPIENGATTVAYNVSSYGDVAYSGTLNYKGIDFYYSGAGYLNPVSDKKLFSSDYVNFINDGTPYASYEDGVKALIDLALSK